MDQPFFLEEVEIRVGTTTLSGQIRIPAGAVSMVLLSPANTGESDHPENTFIAQKLEAEGIGTLIFHMFSNDERIQAIDINDLDFNTERLLAITQWLIEKTDNRYNLGYLGSGPGIAPALRASAKLRDCIKAIVSKGGRPDLAIPVLRFIEAPTLFIIGSLDEQAIEINEKAYDILGAHKRMVFIEGASHQFKEEGKLDEVAEYTTGWFKKHLKIKEEENYSLYRH